VVLTDELNRTTPKTQAALLEAMEERSVSVDGVTHKLPDPFFVVATENPIESQGVFPLPESQADRFAVQIILEPPGREFEARVYENRGLKSALANQSAPNELTLEALAQAQRAVQEVHIDSSLIGYATDVIRETRKSPEAWTGVSVRGGLQWMDVVRAIAYMKGRDFVKPEDYLTTAVPTLAHRLGPKNPYTLTLERRAFVEQCLKRVALPR
jgi:MoxR-like ATPase